jgi:hypothetical protein
MLMVFAVVDDVDVTSDGRKKESFKNWKLN